MYLQLSIDFQLTFSGLKISTFCLLVGCILFLTFTCETFNYALMSCMKLCYSCSNYFLWLLIAANPAGFDPYLILNSLLFYLAVEDAGRWIAFVCAHCGQTLRKGFFSYALGSCTVGVTPAIISYICKSFV